MFEISKNRILKTPLKYFDCIHRKFVLDLSTVNKILYVKFKFLKNPE